MNADALIKLAQITKTSSAKNARSIKRVHDKKLREWKNLIRKLKIWLIPLLIFPFRCSTPVERTGNGVVFRACRHKSYPHPSDGINSKL